MPVKFGKTSKQVDRQTKKVTIVHEYMKSQSIDTLIETYNKEGTKPKLKQKVKNEIVRRNKLGLSNIVFTPVKEETLGL
jgi:Cu/Ag efflux protein CusF|tara:strand:+ start:945 stop:1181 length:237 start_codon:yes stop_codon:yes gene_type:complete